MRRLAAVGLWLAGLAALRWLLPPAPLNAIPVPAGWLPLGVTRNGLFVAYRADTSGTVVGWELATGRERWHTTAALPFKYERYSDQVLTGGRPLDARSGQPADRSAEVPGIVSADGRFRADCRGGELIVTDSATGAVVRRLPVPPHNDPVAVGPDGRLVLTQHGTLWDAESGQSLWSPPGRPVAWYDSGGNVLLSADGRTLIALLPDARGVGSLCWIDAATGREDVSRRRSFPDIFVHFGPVGPRFPGDCMADRQIVLSASRIRRPWAIERWLGIRVETATTRQLVLDADTGTTVATLPRGEQFLRPLDDGRLATITERGEYAVWDESPRPAAWLMVTTAIGWTAAVVLVAGRLRRPRDDR